MNKETAIDSELLRDLLRHLYRADRFEMRDGDTWGADYSAHIVASRLGDLADSGYSCVSAHESTTGSTIWFDRSLSIVSRDVVAAALGWQA